jgi:glycolate oxidase iron-sulfur subunit
MQHSVKVEQLGVRGAVMANAIRACVHCGFCLAACPTYQVLGQEMDSPRGRIYLMKGVLEEAISPAGAQLHIDRCLGCLACVPACPSGVPYGDLLLSYRALFEEERQRPLLDRATRTLICETLPYPHRFRLAARASKIARPALGLLPQPIGAMLRLLPEALPEARPLPAVYPPPGKRRARVALLAGCAQQVIAPEINWATLRVLAANGVETVIPQDQGCCGSILMHIGEEQRAQKLARANLHAFPTDVDAVVTNAAGCGSGMKEYGLLFAGEEEEAAAIAYAGLVKDITVFLDELGLATPGGLEVPLRAAYQDACHLRHAQGVVDAPRRLLQAVPNLTLVELNDFGLCCGSAGTYNIEQPQIADQLGEMKARRIVDCGAEAVISGNVGCLMQMRAHLDRLRERLPVYHTVQLLDLAYCRESARGNGLT